MTSAPRLVLTRRGRLAVTLLVFGVAALIGLVGLDRAVASYASPAGAQSDVVIVRAGQSLGDIASERMPWLPVAEAVGGIRAANGLATTDIHAGQELHVPRR